MMWHEKNFVPESNLKDIAVWEGVDEVFLVLGKCYISYCMTFHIVFFITLTKYPWSFRMDFWGYTFMELLLFLIVDYFMESVGGGASLLYGGWSWLMILVLLSCLCLMDHSLDIWMLATSCFIFFLCILVTMYGD
jgi:hypothetical protein